MRKLLGARSLLAVSAVSCKQADIDITNPNSATVAALSRAIPTALQLLATGLLVDQRGTRPAMITNTGAASVARCTRFTPHGRTQRDALPHRHHRRRRAEARSRRGFAIGPWGGEYGALRDIFNFKNTINASATLTAAQKSAALGFAQTIEALMLFEIVQTHDSLGAHHRDQGRTPFDLAPFVHARLDVQVHPEHARRRERRTLAAGGAAFPFTLAGRAFAGFNTPATLRAVQRGAQGEGGGALRHGRRRRGGVAGVARRRSARRS